MPPLIFSAYGDELARSQFEAAAPGGLLSFLRCRLVPASSAQNRQTNRSRIR